MLLVRFIEVQSHFEIGWFLVATAAGLGAVLGHIFPLFARFKGGKGVATAAGVLAGLLPLALLPAVGVFLLVLITSGYVSLSSMIASFAVLPSYFLFSRYPEAIADISSVVLCSLLVPLVVFLHRKNIRRLANGTENRFDRVRIFAKAKDHKRK